LLRHSSFIPAPFRSLEQLIAGALLLLILLWLVRHTGERLLIKYLKLALAIENSSPPTTKGSLRKVGGQSEIFFC